MHRTIYHQVRSQSTQLFTQHNSHDCISEGEAFRCIHGGPSLAEVQGQRSGLRPQVQPLRRRQSVVLYGYMGNFDDTGREIIRLYNRTRT